MTDHEPTVGELLDDPVLGPSVMEKIARTRHEFDLERVRRPDLYGPVPKSVWKRLKKWRRDHAGA